MTNAQALLRVENKVKRVQELLGVSADGWPGKNTEARYKQLRAAAKADSDGEWGAVGAVVDARSESNIKTLHPRVQPLARALILDAKANGITMVVTSGTRTYEEQNALYEQGRSKPGPIVTNVRGGYSNHNFGIAFDVTEFVNGLPVWESPRYAVVGALGKSLGLAWGGDWTSIQDEPHFQLRPEWARNMTETQMVAGLRERKAKGTDVFT